METIAMTIGKTPEFPEDDAQDNSGSGDQNALPDENVAIELPLEPGDADAQPT